MGLKICVTGGTGYIASWVVKKLLAGGHTVNCTVRDPENEHAQALAALSSTTLVLFKADLMEEGSFDEAVAGCDYVLHMASPFSLSTKNAEKTIIEPAVNGTKNVLSACDKAESVKRVVVTSSVGAIWGSPSDKEIRYVFSEEDWNETSDPKKDPYFLSKTMAEKAAWEVAKDKHYELTTINPGFVMGPAAMGRVEGESAEFMKNLMNGKFAMGAPDIYFALADVRDVAQAHINAMLAPAAAGQRHLLASEVLTIMQMARMLKEDFPRHKLPTSIANKTILYMAAPFIGLSWEYIKKNVGAPLCINNNQSKQNLGLKYTDIKETLVDMVKDFQARGLIKKKEAAA
ncbi:hypothetical protein CYMTET_6139 [Cymbomonas tetramitiformis]|uniref:NAD-dependent epimerase/dehydratase domain-containing protein n=1 Tax=Cymbomonas tetramitiformis TaxID=36881 RepID=A0AAE0GY56_9CHLO|nr:hypothetical protein CYMTET_6139 [Cymbomonas tetramitiformis]